MSTTSNRFSNNSAASEKNPFFDLIDRANYRSARSEPGFGKSGMQHDSRSEVRFGEDAGDFQDRVQTVESVFRQDNRSQKSVTPVPSVRSSLSRKQPSELTADKKLEMQAMMVRDLKMWNAKSLYSARKFDMYSSFEEVRREHAYVKACREKENSVRKYKEYILAFATGATYLNDSVKPVQNLTKVSMKPWLEEFDYSVCEEGLLDVELEALYEKYKHMPSIPPEVAIPFAIAKSFVKAMLTQRRELAKQEERINERTDNRIAEELEKLKLAQAEEQKSFRERIFEDIARQKAEEHETRSQSSTISSSISATSSDEEEPENIISIPAILEVPEHNESISDAE